MSETLVTPKFLTRGIAAMVVDSVVALAMGNLSSMSSFMKRKMCHIVIVVPTKEDDHAVDFPNWLNYRLQPVILYEHSVGKPDWPHDFEKIARYKASQLWHDLNDNRTDNVPHLLFPGDTPYWGGVKRDGIVVACSGVQPHFDRMIAGMVADALIAVAHELWMRSDDKKNEVSFLS